MTETTESPQQSEQPPDPAPRPGVHLAPPGTPPFRPAAPPEPEPTMPEAEVTHGAPMAPPEQPAKKTRASRRRRGLDSETVPNPSSADEPTTPKTSSKTSSERPAKETAPVFVENTQLTEDLTELLLTASVSANDKVAPGTPLLLADRVEAEGLARPAARVIVRHTPAGLGGPGNPDLADAVSAGITLVRYALRQIRLWYEIKRLSAGDATSPGQQSTEDAAA